MGLKHVLTKVGKALVRQFGSEIEREAVQRIDRVNVISHVLIDRVAEKAKREVKKRVKK